MNGVPVLEIFKNGTINKYPTITVEADGKEAKNFLSLQIRANDVAIGRIAIKFESASIPTANPNTIDAVLSANGGSLVYEIHSPRYSLVENNLGNTSF